MTELARTGKGSLFARIAAESSKNKNYGQDAKSRDCGRGAPGDEGKPGDVQRAMGKR